MKKYLIISGKNKGKEIVGELRLTGYGAMIKSKSGLYHPENVVNVYKKRAKEYRQMRLFY